MPAEDMRSSSVDPQIELIDVAVSSAQEEGEAEVTGVGWRLWPGEFWAVGGIPSWAPSQLLLTMAGLEPPLGGAARWFGRTAEEMTEEELQRNRQRIGIVRPGGGRMFHGQTVAENVALPLRYHRNWSETDAAEHVAALLELTGLAAVGRKSASALGRHWRQRIGLARALGVGPEVLMLDQPLARLSQEEGDWWRGFLERLRGGSLPLPGIRPRSIVITAEEISPWRGLASHLAAVEKKRWRTPDHEAKSKADEPRIPA